MKEKKYDPEKEIEKICEENKLSIDLSGFNKIKAINKLKLLHDRINKFIETGKDTEVLIVDGIGVKIRVEKSKNEIDGEIIKILKREDLLEVIDSELDKKIVGEHAARKSIIIVCNMKNVVNLGKATDNLMINAVSGTGKDYVGESIFEIFPNDEKEELLRTTPKVLAYTRNKELDPNATWKKICLRLEDVSNEVLNDDAFKVMSSANPNKINKTKIVNKGKVIPISIEGKPSIILTIANPNPKEETLRRYPICHLDEGIDQTKEILKRQAKFAMTGKSLDYNEKITKALKNLRRISVKIPFAQKLVDIFCPENVIVRTHFPRFLDYIKSSCSLHQYQREMDDAGYYIAQKKDYEVARQVLVKTTSNILMIPLTKLRQTILDVFEEENVENKSVDEINDYSEIQKLNISPEWLRRQLDWLVSKSFLKKDKEKRKDDFGKLISKPTYVYSHNPIQKLDIPTWEELENISSNTNNNKNSSNSSNSSNSRVNEVNEVNDLKRDITTNEEKIILNGPVNAPVIKIGGNENEVSKLS